MKPALPEEVVSRPFCWKKEARARAVPQQKPPTNRSFRERVAGAGLPCLRRTVRRAVHRISRNTKAMTDRDALKARSGTCYEPTLCATKAVPQINAASTAKDDCRRELRSIYLLLLTGCGKINDYTVRPQAADAMRMFVHTCIYVKF